MGGASRPDVLLVIGLVLVASSSARLLPIELSLMEKKLNESRFSSEFGYDSSTIEYY